MAKETITARYAQKVDGKFKLDGDGKKVMTEMSAEYDFGGNLEGLIAIAKGNKEAVFSNAVANLKVVIQSLMRGLHGQGSTPDAIAKEVASYVPGVAVRKAAADPVAAAKMAFAGMSPEKQKAFLKELQQG